MKTKEIVYLITGIFAGLLIAYVGYSLTQSKPLGGITTTAYLGNAMTVTTSSVTSATKILSANSDRQYALIQNGAVASYLRFSSYVAGTSTLATTTDAVYLAAYGTYVINATNLYLGDVYATSTAGASVFSVTTK